MKIECYDCKEVFNDKQTILSIIMIIKFEEMLVPLCNNCYKKRKNKKVGFIKW